jgi:signal transduction histidine kinase
MKKELFTYNSGKGHGFGLFLSSEILAITGITITEEGEPGKGARFVITATAEGLRMSRTEKALTLGVLESEGQ